MAESSWNDDLYVTIYRLAKSGMSDTKIADTLGISYRTFANWKKKKSALRRALKEARTPEDGIETFQDYVYSKLPRKLQKVWDAIQLAETEPNHVKRMEALLAECGKRSRQRLFLYALVNSNFNPSEACRKIQTSKKMFERWVMNDPAFAELVEEIDWHKKNFFEGALVGAVGRGEVGAIIFANRQYNADRGYGNKIQVDHTHVHSHSLIPIDDLDLPLEDRKKILQAVRERREADRPGGPRTALPESVEDSN